MDQPRVDNRTELVVHPQVLLDKDGERLCTIVKASFELLPGDDRLVLAPAARMRPVRTADIPWGEPDVSSIGFPADVCLRKPGVDVVVVGRAYAPGDRPVPSFDVRVEVGPLKKSLRIVGPRVWTGGGALTSPGPIGELDLRYEYAWGGFDDSDPERPVEEPKNPIGRGKVRDSASRKHQPAPQIEDPAHLLSDRAGEPPPAGVGAVGRHWLPRRAFAGTYDAAWLETRAPLPPPDFDDRFNLCATPDLCSREPLAGGELVRLLNVTPGGGALSFALPAIRLDIDYRVDGRAPAVFQPHLDTVLIDVLETSADKPAAVELVWRASIPAPRKVGATRIIVSERP